MNQYDWLEKHFMDFYLKICEVNNIIPHPDVNEGLITAHGDKCYQYKREWEGNGIHFFHGCACYLLTYLFPWSSEVRATDNGWVKPVQWVMDNYDTRFRPYLPMIMEVELSYKKEPPKPTPDGQKVRWVSDYYPIGHWEDEDGNHLIIEKQHFHARLNGREVVVVLVSVTQHGTHGEGSITGDLPRFYDLETSKSVQVESMGYLTLINTVAEKEPPHDPYKGLVQVGEVLPGRGMVKNEV